MENNNATTQPDATMTSSAPQPPTPEFQSAPPATPETPEPQSPEPIAPEPTPKKSNKILIIILSVVLVAIIGVVAYMFLKQPEPPKPVEPAKSDQSEQQNSETEEDSNDTSPATEPEESEDNDLSYDEEYVYINRWGIKLKLDSGTTVLSYSFKNETEVKELAIEIVSNNLYSELTENVSESELKNYIPGNYITRSKDTKFIAANGSQHAPVFNDGEYNYFAWQPSGYNLSPDIAVYSEEIQNDFKKAYETLNKPGTYSKL